MTEDTLYWLFSTIAQTYGAIVGIMGMLTVYRLQTLSRYREDCRKRAEGFAHDVLDYEVEACGLSPEDLVENGKISLGNKTNLKQKLVQKMFK